MVCCRHLVTAISLVLATRAHAADLASDIRNWVEKERQKNQVVGLSVSVVERHTNQDNILFNEGFGTIGFDEVTGSTAPVTNKTLFRVASISKTIVAQVVASLVDSRRFKDIRRMPLSLDTKFLDIDAPLCRKLRKFALEKKLLKSPFWLQITLRQMLGHTSGLQIEPVGQDRWFNYDLKRREGRAMNDVEYERQILQMDFAYAPGKIPAGAGNIKYSNLAYNLLAKMTGELLCRYSWCGINAFQNHVRNNLFVPNGMMTAIYNLPRTPLARNQHMRGYSDLRPARDGTRAGETWHNGRIQAPLLYEPEFYSGSTGASFSSTDAARYMLHYLRVLEGESGRFISRRSLLDLLEPLDQVTSPSSLMVLGHSWKVEPERNSSVGFTGVDSSFLTSLRIFVEKGIGISIFAPMADFDERRYQEEILKIVNRHNIGNDYDIASETASMILKAKRYLPNYVPPANIRKVELARSGPAKLKPYIGHYSSRLYRDLDVAYTTEGGLALVAGGEVIYPLDPASYKPKDDFGRVQFFIPQSDWYHSDFIRFEFIGDRCINLIEANGFYYHKSDNEPWI